ncbi:EthD domain-containing protein [Amycolatopsis halotolerans]|uniref:EthD domain-containing protein n=1 Tax=Amycolatopsis halotolerans TaxID=330083 RepID=A0ABV7QGC2_9PSEU
MIKFVYLINRVNGMSFEEFVEYHRDRHAPLFTSIPEAHRYVRNRLGVPRSRLRRDH